MWKWKAKDNYLEYIPIKNPKIEWKVLQNGHIQIVKEHKGIFFWITQKLMKKPKISYIEMEEFGSFIWQTIDGKKTVFMISEEVHKKFGKKAEPLVTRLAKYLNILYEHRFILYDRNLEDKK